MVERGAEGRILDGGSLVTGKMRGGGLTLAVEGRRLRRGLGWVLERASGGGRVEVQGEASGRRKKEELIEKAVRLVQAHSLGLSSLRLLSDPHTFSHMSPLQIIFGLEVGHVDHVVCLWP